MKIIIGEDCKNCKYHGVTYGTKSMPQVVCNIDEKSRNYGQFYDCSFREENKVNDQGDN